MTTTYKKKAQRPAPPESGTVSVTLLKPHTHAGVAYPKGALLEVPEDKVKWLTDQGVV